ncbi:FxSxx-COOH system tetratricopeptide repeat protein, partial [Candidatus Protofrankia datiscae]
MTRGGDEATDPDFFVSYTGGDRAWAEWIAWVLEDADYRVVIQAWDFRAGAHFVEEVQQATARATRTVAVLSAAYLESAFTAPEWQEAWRADPSGQARKLLVFRIEQCPRPGLLAQVVMVDLFGIRKDVARRAVLAAAAGRRGKPATEPDFPGGPAGTEVAVGAPVFPPDLPAMWNVPARLANFVGRESLLTQIHDRLAATGSVAVTVLEGMGGVGKTALAVEYIHRYADAFDRVGWVPAEQPELVGGYLAGLASMVGLSQDAEPAAVVAAWARRPRSLLVFDNADDPETVKTIKGLRPSPGAGRLLVTSRRRGFTALGATVTVPLLPRAEAMRILTDRFPALDPTVADQICDLLGDLPLAVEQAAGYLDQTGTPPEEYAELLAKYLGDMLAEGEVADRPGVTVAVLWELSVRRLRDECPAAVELLELWALCAPETIPLDLFGDPAGFDDGPLKNAAASRAVWAHTVGALVGYSLARRDQDTVDVHRLVQATTRHRLPSDRQKAHTATLLRLFRANLPGDVARNPQVWPRWRALLPHVRTVLDRGGDSAGDDSAWLCDRAAVYLRQEGQFALAIPLSQRALAEWTLVLGPNHPDTLTSCNNLADAYRAAGRLKEAIGLHERTLAVREKVRGPNHPDTLASRNNLANAYQEAGRLKEAISLHERTLTDRKRVLGADAPETLASCNNLANAYQEAGRHDDAIRLHKQTLADRERIRGPNHLETLASHNNLANAYQTAGRLKEAIGLYERTLTDRERVLGADDPDTLASRNNLANAYQAAGRHDDAIHLHQRTLTDRERILGPNHPRTLASRNNIVNAYQAAGRHDDAIGLYERTLTDRAQLQGPNHPRTLTARNNLANAYQAAGRHDDAIHLHQQTLTDRERILGADDPDTLASRSNLADAYRTAGRLNDAIRLYERTLTDRAQLQGPNHPRTLTTRNNLASAYRAAGRLKEAIGLYERTLTDRVQLQGPNHPTTLTARNNLANAYQAAGQHDDAIHLHQQTLT